MNPGHPKPLAGRRIVITRAKEQAGAFADLLHSYGAEVIELPTIAIRPPESFAALDEAIGRLSDYHWVIFTSVNGVRAFFDRLSFHGRDGRALKGLRVCAIGPATAEALEAQGVSLDLVPAKFQAEGILEAWKGKDLRGVRILLPRAAVAREVLPEELRKAGAVVNVVPAYRTFPAEGKADVRARILSGAVDVVTFTSPSTVDNFFALFSEEEIARLAGLIKVAAIGPVTRSRAESRGLSPEIEADPFTIPALAEAIVRHYESHSTVQPPSR
ncbi:MAG: uroporphyrinogen-III synthase [Nitrospinota bacterium]